MQNVALKQEPTAPPATAAEGAFLLTAEELTRRVYLASSNLSSSDLSSSGLANPKKNNALLLSPYPASDEGKEKFADYRKAIEATMQAMMREVEPKNLAEPITYVLQQGGKRIRPLLTMLSCGSVGGNPYFAVAGGIVVEILHNFTLVHDDIMDGADLRRGQPTVHKRWNNDVAILSGDAMMALAYKFLLQRYGSMPRFAELLDLTTRSILKVCAGQVEDMELQRREDISMREYIAMAEKKTARMLELSVSLGAVLGNARARELALLRQFSRSLGVAFQILDDALDISSTAKEFGKTIGGDIIEGKKTFLIAYAVERRDEMNGEDRQTLDEFCRRGGAPAERVPEMARLLERVGALDAARKAVAFYTERARRALEKLPPSENRTMLYTLSDMLLERTR